MAKRIVRKVKKKATRKKVAKKVVKKAAKKAVKESPPEKLLSPRQVEFLSLYLNPQSETFGNARGSAIAAGFSEEYADQITYENPEWFQTAMERRTRLLDKAEQVLEDTLDDYKADRKLAQDTAKFVAKTQGKSMGYGDTLAVKHSGAVALTKEREGEIDDAIDKMTD